ncbi:hypothetical protein ACHHYP_09040 [Achlya hypogyna]|uniref:JmjC domain-containing protein n=1 Tax=Achlya hypogyna TaxID=1202772 RepID=A0A1V9ZJN2_ACHHY|nr:hypothetical protein ACHHYP_09040 [Achlya hypogyna]
MDPLTEVARWYRGQKRGSASTSDEAFSVSADTRLHRILRLDETKAFLKERLAEIRRTDGSEIGSLRAALYTELLDPIDPRLLPYLRVHSASCELHKAAYERVKFNLDMAQRLAAFETPSEPVAMTAVPVVDVRDLPVEYAMEKRPVVLKGGAALVMPADKMWTLASLQTHPTASLKRVPTKRYIADSVRWARLEEGPVLALGDFVESLPSSNLYLHDHSVPLHFPDLIQDVSIPSYFAADFLQRMPEGSLYRETWPSLFVGPRGSASQLHIDSFGSNFWMALLQGRKHWVLVDPDDMHLLRPQLNPGLHDVVFEAELRLPADSTDVFQFARRQECILEAGDILFVPSGTPHYVGNLTDTVALSANYIDESNWKEAVAALERQATTDPRARDVARHIVNCVNDSLAKQSPGASIPFAEFKRPAAAVCSVTPLPAVKRAKLDAEFLADWSDSDND